MKHLLRLEDSFFSCKLHESTVLISNLSWDLFKVHRRTIALNKPVSFTMSLLRYHTVVHRRDKLASLFSRDKSNNEKHSALISLFIFQGPSVSAAFLCVYLPSSTLCCNQLRAAPRV